MESLSPEIQNLVLEIATKNHLTNYTVDVNKSVSNEGDGYVGILNGLSLIDKDSDTKLNLVLKTAPANANLKKQFTNRAAFLKEIRMYDEVIPELLKFQAEYNIPNPFQSVTKLYAYNNEEFKETLILRNLKTDGYKLCKRQEPMDSNHLSLVITEYAKLHALSHAMKKLEPERFEKLVELIGDNKLDEFNKKQEQENDVEPVDPLGDLDELNVLFGLTLEALKDKPKETKAIERFRDSFWQLVTMKPEEDTKVISHGDCWSANLLFRYEDEDNPQIPTKLCIIDWQLSLFATPIFDLSYFFMINAGRSDLENYMRYLKLYHSALSETLTGFGLDSEKVYSFELFEKEWKEQSKFGLYMVMTMIQHTLSEGKMADFDKLAGEGQTIYEYRKNEVTDLFNQRIIDLVDVLVAHDLI